MQPRYSRDAAEIVLEALDLRHLRVDVNERHVGDGARARRVGERRGVLLQVTSYKLQVTSYKLQATSYKLQVTSYKLQVTSYKLQVTSYKLQVTSYKLQVTSYKLHVTGYIITSLSVTNCAVQ